VKISLVKYLEGFKDYQVWNQNGIEIIDGLLIFSSLDQIFIVNGIPRFVPHNYLLYDQDFISFLEKYKHQDSVKKDIENFIKDKKIQESTF